MALQHFSHEHPLALVDEVPKDDDGKQQSVCYGCQEPITSPFYSCDKCNYFLHKKCGELPHGVKHPQHPKHPLTLLAHPYYDASYCICNVCSGDWKWFTYHCSECKFDAHVSCTPLEERPNEHIFHDHPLTFTRRKATFFCDACGTEGEDLSYRCTSTSCEFWIHDTCASLPNTIKRNDHYHPLQLTYSIPYSKHKFNHSCYICKKIVHPNYWVYYCASCTYFAHLKCGTSEEEPISDGKSEENLDPNLIHFPMPEESMVQLMTQILIEKNLNKRVIVSNEMENREILCDVCIQLPTSSQHPEHPIDLRHSKYFNFDFCFRCRKYNHQYCFEGKACTSFELGACCATTCLPTTIKHEAHKHPLVLQSKDTPYFSPCTACGDELYSRLRYGCDTCNNFHLEYQCATLPATVIHEWDRHPISLTYPPFDHPDDYFCEICEEDIHPAHWLYHCSICDHSFHVKCLRQEVKDWWSNVKFGGIYKFEHHPHNLTFVRRRKKKSSLCDHYHHRQSWQDDYPVLECTTCSFNLCIECARKESTRK